MQVFETPGPIALHVGLGAGLVSVEAADVERTEVELEALRDDEITREALAETTVELIEKAGRRMVVIEVPKRKSSWLGLGRGPTIGVRVRCPLGSDFDVSSSSADLKANGRFGEADVKSASGDVAVESVDGSFKAGTASGDVAVGEVGGTCSIKTASGDAEVRTARGPLSLNLVSGDAIVGEARGSLSVNTVSGDQRIGAVSGGEIRLQSVSGDVRVGVRPGLRLWIDATSVSGSMHSELDTEDAPPPGDGELVELRARTVSGDVQIVRAADVPV